MPFAITWMDLGDIMLSEISPTEQDKYCISLICGIQKTKQNEQKTKLIDTKNRLVVARSQG